MKAKNMKVGELYWNGHKGGILHKVHENKDFPNLSYCLIDTAFWPDDDERLEQFFCTEMKPFKTTNYNHLQRQKNFKNKRHEQIYPSRNQ